jgi:5-formyltetrahydrofolate cyclo-ligase
MTKSEIRIQMLEKRDAINENQHLKLSLKAVKQIQAHHVYQQARVVGIYHPIKNELNLLSLLDDQKTFLLPVVKEDNMHYHLYKNGDTLTKSTLQILEPKDNPVMDDTLELIIVPALAVNKEGHRIGYGKGFFDQFIKSHSHIKTLTVVLDFQVINELPIEKHDQQVQTLIVLKGDHDDY